MSFAVNQRVQAIDEDFEGRIVAIYNRSIDVESDEGFIIRFRESELISIPDTSLSQEIMMVTPKDITEKQQDSNKNKISKSFKRPKVVPPLEVDLHIHKLVQNTRNLTNYDMLTIQMETAKRQLDFAFTKRIQRVVFIHGVGEGVLKEELYTLLRRYDGLKFYDADYKKYGLGGTEVYLFQNK